MVSDVLSTPETEDRVRSTLVMPREAFRALSSFLGPSLRATLHQTGSLTAISLPCTAHTLAAPRGSSRRAASVSKCKPACASKSTFDIESEIKNRFRCKVCILNHCWILNYADVNTVLFLTKLQASHGFYFLLCNGDQK